MAPKKVIPKPKVANVLVGIRKSKRSKAISKSKESGRHHDETELAVISEIPPLNDDCLLHIFSFLPIRHLWYNVAACCRQFKTLAGVVLQRKCRDERFIFDYSDKRDASFVKRFGEFMRDIDVCDKTYYTFQRTFNHSFTWLKHCTSLKNLKIWDITPKYNHECAHTLQNLDSLTLNHYRPEDYWVRALRDFLLACKNLKSITIETDKEYISSESLVCLTHLVNIERITMISPCCYLNRSIEIATRMAQLNNLKFFSFCGGSSSFALFIDTLSASQSLEALVLYVNLFPASSEGNFVKGLDKFPNLKTCELNYRWYTSANGTDPKKERYHASYLSRNVKNFDVVENSLPCERNEPYVRKKYSVTLWRKK